ncbi:MAG: heme-binding domain-containing protein [Ignavibacterium sp.]|nr:heme-binding domain-containing protein [Ignavibacterium sp.]MDW8376444.1 heme-binding domain-containing protein [Ignavibacteriales bacterium]
MKKLLIIIAVILIGIQFIPVERTNPPVKNEMPMPSKVKEVISRACYDCHSNNTEWKWYSKVAPMSFLISYDVKEGREHLNFTEWNYYSMEENEIKQEIWEEVLKERMPPWSYRVVNPKGKLSEEDKRILREWALER